ncbi:MAG: DUF2461 family protein [Bacteroidota bacterium]|nr:DUF2461 family protein [Bacteroidota bacterium]
MKDQIGPFNGFSDDVFNFLTDLSHNNSVEWFSSNRARYQNSLVQPARSFVVEMADFFNRLYPAIRTEPKFNETLMRLNKDMRFSKGEPYRTYFLVHFGKFKLDSEFYVSFEPESFDYGLFINNSGENKNFYFRRNIERYKNHFLNILDKYEINHNYELYELKKGPIILDKDFEGERHFDIIKELPMMLIQKSLRPKESEIIFSADFILEAIRVFSNLFPLYCFAAFAEPLKMIDTFEEEFGHLA